MGGSLLGNVAAAAYFLLFQLCGILCARCLLFREGRGVRLLLGSVLGTVMLQWFPALFAFLFQFSPAAHGAAGILALACALGGVMVQARRKEPPLKESLFVLIRRRKFLLFIMLLWLFYCFLVVKSFFLEGGKIHSSQATYGDMNMHLGFITSLAKQQVFPPDYSILPGVKLSYPFLSDSISSSLYLFGSSLRFAYMLPMWFAGGQVMLGFALFSLRMLNGKGAPAAIAFVLFFFNGGLGFFYFLGGEPGNFTRIFTAFYETPTNLVENGVRWVNVIVDMMLPQRATLFGWAALFPLLYLLYRAVFNGKGKYFLYAGILAGALPMIHTHSFLAFALVCGAWLLFGLIREGKLEDRAVRVGKILVVSGLLFLFLLKLVLNWLEIRESVWLLIFALLVAGATVGYLILLLVKSCKEKGIRPWARAWGVLLGATLCLALPQLCYWTFRQAGENSEFVRGYFGWSMGEENYLWFYLKNIGIAALLILGGLLTAKKEQFIKYSPALVIWFLGEFVVFQPNEYDNNKLLYVAFAFLCCAGAEFTQALLEKLKRRGVRLCVASGLTVVCTVSAVLTMGRESVARYELYSIGAVSLCDYVERTIPVDATILTDVRHNNEVAALTGRNVVCGSPSYLFFHGLHYEARKEAVQLMYEEPEKNKELFEQFSVDYILVSSYERESYNVDFQALNNMFPRIYNDSTRSIYQVTNVWK